MSKPMTVSLGPPVPFVPGHHFSSLDDELIKKAWQVVGPSVERNFCNARCTAPLWQIFAACYAEGLNHGIGIMGERRNPLAGIKRDE